MVLELELYSDRLTYLASSAGASGLAMDRELIRLRVGVRWLRRHAGVGSILRWARKRGA